MPGGVGAGPAGAPSAVPLTETVGPGVIGSLLLTVSVAGNDPAAVGLNVTVTVQRAPAATVAQPLTSAL